MTDMIFYIIEDTKELCFAAFELFMKYLEYDEENWLEYSNGTSNIYCDEDTYYSFTVGKLDDGNYVLITDREVEENAPNKAIEFELLVEWTCRF